MDQTAALSSTCRSFFRESAEAPTVESYTRLWVKLINQMERGKEILSAAR